MPAGGREKMRYIVNSREMNLYDSRTIEEFHMPQAVLMERAAFSFVGDTAPGKTEYVKNTRRLRQRQQRRRRLCDR